VIRVCFADVSAEAALSALERATREEGPPPHLLGVVARDRIVVRRKSLASRMPPVFSGGICCVEGKTVLKGEIRPTPIAALANLAGTVLLCTFVGWMVGERAGLTTGVGLGGATLLFLLWLQRRFALAEEQRLATDIRTIITGCSPAASNRAQAKP
jgi:hypothetical protein